MKLLKNELKKVDLTLLKSYLLIEGNKCSITELIKDAEKQGFSIHRKGNSRYIKNAELEDEKYSECNVASNNTKYKKELIKEVLQDMELTSGMLAQDIYAKISTKVDNIYLHTVINALKELGWNYQHRSGIITRRK